MTSVANNGPLNLIQLFNELFQTVLFTKKSALFWDPQYMYMVATLAVACNVTMLVLRTAARLRSKQGF